MRRTLTDKGVAALRARLLRYAFPDPELRGHWVRVQPSGAKSFVSVARNPAGKQVWTTIGNTDAMSIDEARDKARTVVARVRSGLSAFEAPAPAPESFQAIAEQWLLRHGEAKALRSLKNIRRLLRVHVFPHWSDRPFLEIRRSDVAALLDQIEDNHGARQADLVLTVIRSIMNWFATRNDDYTPVVVRGMRRQNPKQQSRARILDDDEIRAIWNVAGDAGRFGAIVKLCLLTAQRRTKVSAIKWSDISVDGVWTIAQEAREKDTAGELKLSAIALEIVRAQPRIGANPYVFAGRNGGPFSGFSVTKTAFDAKLPELEPWVIHDLRRTARSLMARAGVTSEHAERVMGHAIAGVEGIYDRHTYRDEKANALARLATLIDGIVNPRDNVEPMRKRAKR
jgi:integrase